MNSNTKSASGLRRSAVVERLRLKEEWSALKGTTNETEARSKQKNTKNKKNTEKKQQINEVLSGIVVLVEVGSEPRALALRAALSALGATVVPAWTPFVTHLVWTQGGCRSIRAKARALACRLVSPLWVESCAAEGKKLPERIFPAPTRPSDLPSPGTLRRFLKKAEKENIPLHDWLSDSADGGKVKPRLRLSSETDRDTTHSTDVSHDASRDKSQDGASTEKRVNTAPKRPPATKLPDPKSKRTRRKLFTQKEPDIQTTDDSDDETETAGPKRMQLSKMTQRERRDLAAAERMARLIVGTSRAPQGVKPTLGTQCHNMPPRIVLTGMPQKERQEVWHAIKHLNGKIQRRVDRKTTHVILGSCHEPTTPQTKSPETGTNTPIPMCNKCNSPGTILSKLFTTNVIVDDYSQGREQNGGRVKCKCQNEEISGVRNISNVTTDDNLVFPVVLNCQSVHTCLDLTQKDVMSTKDNNIQNGGNMENVGKNNKPRTVNALLGAARGCKVVRPEWVKDSLKADRWLNHVGYEVPHLKKISENARVERSALRKINSEYGYNVFRGMRVKISEDAEQKEAITQLLALCGAVTQDGGQIQDGGQVTAEFDLTVGRENGDVSSKWVFDSIAAARMRTTRRYINKL